MNTITTKPGILKMDTITSKLIGAGILFLFTLISGVILSHSSRPLNIGLVTLHKLIAVGTAVLVGMTINQLYKSVDGKFFIEIGLMVISALLLLALIATGAFLTREEMQLPDLVLNIHKVAPLLALISSTLAIFLLSRGQS
ncbi:MAG: hypothetical protein PVJ21_04375 [Anaerolineales bacterium]